MSVITASRLRSLVAALPMARPAVRLGRRGLQAWREQLGKWRTERELREGWSWFGHNWRNAPPFDLLGGTPSSVAVPVIMCLWNRPHRIEIILQMLDAQVGPTKLRLIFWSNNANDHGWYYSRLKAFEAKGAVESIELVRSPFNIRGIARFIAMRKLVVEGLRGPVIMLDDDQDIPSDFVTRLLQQWRPRSIVGCWAWHASPDHYWRRSRPAPGESANYVGTGGCACDSALVADDAFFTRLPHSGLFLEDVWMSRYALSHGWSVERSHAQVSFDHAADNQYHDLTVHKVAFWRTLQQSFPLPSSLPS